MTGQTHALHKTLILLANIPLRKGSRLSGAELKRQPGRTNVLALIHLAQIKLCRRLHE